jgi:hypothetical protein
MTLPVLTLAALLAAPVQTVNGEAHFSDMGALLPGLEPGAVVDQQIVAQHNDLSAVGLLFATSGGKSATRLRFEVLDAEGSVLRQRIVDSRTLNDVHYSDIPFAPISRSQGRTLHLQLQVLEVRTGPLLGLVAASEDSPTAPLTLNGESLPQTLVVRTYYGAPVPAFHALPLLLSRASQFKPPWLKIPWLTLWIAVAVLATGAALISIARLLADDDES